jgi:transcriptional regulator with XRE-family HTH domain
LAVGRRVKHLIDSHGHSLRQAEAITGVSYETIRRVINGYEGPTLVYQVTKIANGYKVDPKALLEGLDPKGDFEWTIHQLPPGQRLEMAMMSLHERVRVTLSFLRDKYPSVCRVEVLAPVSGLQPDELDTIMRRWAIRPPDLRTTLDIARGISRLTSISMSWLVHGWIAQEEAQRPVTERIARLCFRVTQRSKQHIPDRTRTVLQLVRSAIGGIAG